jgi:hypothetical protein
MSATIDAPSFARAASRPHRSISQVQTGASVGSIAAEIGAYVAIRDGLLSTAEASISAQALDRVYLANEFVLNCVRSSGSPYEAQDLEMSDAVRVRVRCEAVKMRIAALRLSVHN